MNYRFTATAAAILAVSLIVPCGFASDTATPQKKQTTTKATKAKKEKAPPAPSVQDQIQALRQELEGQINGLKSDLSTKDAQLKKAEQAAADAQAAADKANAAAASQQQAVSENATAVSTLKSTVDDMKGSNASIAATLSDETASLKKEMASPNVLHYKGISITPGGFVAAETVYRTKATGGDIPTAFTSIPYEGADAYSLSEFYGSARQSRITMQADGKTSWGTLRGYYEADFLGTGITSNNNQSNSYVLRQRILYGQAQTNSGWTFAGGQLWSLATEQKKGITSAPSDVLTPLTVDPNYVTGFVWTRQYGFRVVKSFNKFAIGIAAENPQLLYSASLAGNTPYAVLGSAGQNGGNYNAAISASATTTYIQNYDNQTVNGVSNWVAAYKTVVANTNIANLSFNQAPDVLVKAAFDPGWGHYEVFGIAGFAQETVYPGVTTNSTLFGGKDAYGKAIVDITTGLAPVAASTTAGHYSNSITLGGIGGSLRVPVIKDKVTFGAKGLYGPGMGRYGDSTLSDVTADSKGNLAPIHNLSGLLTLEATPTPRLTIYLNYGGDYAGRTDFANSSATTLSIGSKPVFCPTGATGSACTNAPTAAQLTAGGTWGAQYTSAAAAVGYGSRLLTSSTACGAVANPSYNGSSTGYYPGGSCSAQNRDVQELTGGYWYDIYKGDKGRLRQGIQYGYAVREGWSSNTILGAKGIDNMVWTTFRYYLP
jgi:hypothetical protein